MQHKQRGLPAWMRARWSIASGSLVLTASAVAGIAASGATAQASTTAPLALVAAGPGLGGYCLDGQGSTVAGTPIGTWQCKDASNPNESMANQSVVPSVTDHTVRMSGNCMTGPATGSPGVHLATCTPGDKNQKWYAKVVPGSSPLIGQIVNEATQTCLAPQAGVYPMALSACATGSLSAQTWYVSNQWPTAAQITPSPLALAAAGTGLVGDCLDGQYGGVTAGTALGTWQCKDATNPNEAVSNQSVVPSTTDHTVRMQGVCMAGPATGAPGVHLATCVTGDANQRWYAKIVAGSSPLQAQVVNESTQTCLSPQIGVYPMALSSCATSGADLSTQTWFVSDQWPTSALATIPSGPAVRPASAGSGAIASLAYQGSCMDAFAGRLAPGTTVGVYDCGGDKANQTWTPNNGNLLAGTSCLEADSDGAASLETCVSTSGDAQQWVAIGQPGEPVQIVGGTTHGCLTATSGTEYPLTVTPCVDPATDPTVTQMQVQQQLWWVPTSMPTQQATSTSANQGPDQPITTEPPEAPLTTLSNVEIVSGVLGDVLNTGTYFAPVGIEPDQNSTDVGPHIVIRNAADQDGGLRWDLVPVSDGSGKFVIKNRYSGKCIDLYSQNNTLWQNNCNLDHNQQWRLAPISASDHTWKIVHDATGDCMNLLGGHTWDSAWVGIYSCNDSDPNNVWKITSSGGSDDGVAASYPTVKEFATASTLALCNSEPERCQFDADSQSLAVRNSTSVCISELQHAGGSGTVTLDLQKAHGWDNTVGGDVSIEAETGFNFIVKGTVHITMGFNYSHTISDTVGAESAQTVNANKDDWVWFTRNTVDVTYYGNYVVHLDSGDVTIPSSITNQVGTASDGSMSYIQSHVSSVEPSGLNCPTFS